MRLFPLLLGLLRLAARLFGFLERRAAISAAERAAVAEQALKIAARAGAARRIEEQVAGMTDDEVRQRLREQGDFRP